MRQERLSSGDSSGYYLRIAAASAAARGHSPADLLAQGDPLSKSSSSRVSRKDFVVKLTNSYPSLLIEENVRWREVLKDLLPDGRYLQFEQEDQFITKVLRVVGV